MTPSALQNHGANRCQTSASGSSARICPSTRSATFSIDTNTMPIIVMWIVCSSGVSHSRRLDRDAEWSGLQPLRELEHARYRLVRAGVLPLCC